MKELDGYVHTRLIKSTKGGGVLKVRLVFIETSCVHPCV